MNDKKLAEIMHPESKATVNIDDEGHSIYRGFRRALDMSFENHHRAELFPSIKEGVIAQIASALAEHFPAPNYTGGYLMGVRVDAVLHFMIGASCKQANEHSLLHGTGWDYVGRLGGPPPCVMEFDAHGKVDSEEYEYEWGE